MAKQTIDFIAKHAPNHIAGVHKLKEELGIDSMLDEQLGLVSLIYNQIDSPKMHPIVQECRGLILDIHTLDVVCRPFDRFFNYGEAGTLELVNDTFVYYEKMDGSLIKVYHHKGQWLIGTKSTITSDATIGEEDKLFNDLVYEAAGVDNAQQFTDLCNASKLQHGLTYMFELLSPHNRVITHYRHTCLVWLSVRNNRTGEYVPYDSIAQTWEKFPAQQLTPLPFSTIPEAESHCSKLRDLKEGLVGYRDGVPIIKVKSPLYVAAHHMANAPTLKRFLEIILLNEVDEYLTYYPKDRKVFEAVSNRIEVIKSEMDALFQQHNHISDQKQFAAAVKRSPYSAFVFFARRNKTTPSQEFYKMEFDRRVRFVLDQMNNEIPAV